MPGTLQNDQDTNVRTHRSNGARLVSTSGDTLPLRTVSLTADVAGGIARTVVHQHFANVHASPLELQYLFPLPADGAISGYEFEAGERRIVGRVERRDDARAEYDAARLAGRTAALVEQQRSNLFTQHLGNIPPFTDVTVRLTVDQPLRWLEGAGWEWRFPTVVAPRYLGAEGAVADAAAVTVDVTRDSVGPQASLAVNILDDVRGVPASPTHSVLVNGHTVTLEGGAPLDRDIVIRWAVQSLEAGCTMRVGGPSVEAADSSIRFGLLTIVPPAAAVRTLPRDLVLLLDVSGSMQGRPLAHLKSIVAALIERLGDEDTLDMVAFSSTPVRYTRDAVGTTEPERRKALAWVESLAAGGATELIPAIEEALRPRRPGVSRQVVVVTDGLIGFEADAVRAIRDALPGGSRLHAVGVGSASNRDFLRPAARAGLGVEIVIDLDEAAEQGVARILAATSQPVATDVTIDGTALLDGPRRLPDLLSGSPVLAGLRMRGDGGTLVVRGQTAAGPWEEQAAVMSLPSGASSEMIRALWARETIEDLELDLACGGSRKEIDARIEDVALAHSISSRLTSWIAVAAAPGVDPRDPVRVERIPQVLPYGMSAAGLGILQTQDMARATRQLDFDSMVFCRLDSRQEEKSERWFATRALVESRRKERKRARKAAKSPGSGQLLPGPLCARVYPTPGRSTSTLEITATCAFEWRPSGTATAGGRTVSVAEEGTTRPGRIVPGMQVRVELEIAPDKLRAARYVEIATAAGVLLVEFDAVG